MTLRRQAVIKPSKEPKIRFGLVGPDDFGRVVIYTSVHVHVEPQQIGPEVSFVKSDSRGISAVIDKVPEITTKVVDAIAQYAVDPYGPHIAIRISRSDNPDYGSKIVFYKMKDVQIDEICSNLANVMYTHVSYTSSRFIQDERPSARELRARFQPGFPFDYSMR